jgi:hypothetical protein
MGWVRQVFASNFEKALTGAGSYPFRKALTGAGSHPFRRSQTYLLLDWTGLNGKIDK